MVAAAASQFDQVVALMENGADPNNCDAEGATVLDMAWNNRAMQKTLTDTAARIGAGVSGSGRQRGTDKTLGPAGANPQCAPATSSEPGKCECA